MQKSKIQKIGKSMLAVLTVGIMILSAIPIQPGNAEGQQPYIIWGYIFEEEYQSSPENQIESFIVENSPIPLPFAIVNVTNQMTGEFIITLADENARYSVDIAQMQSGYQDGDIIQVTATHPDDENIQGYNQTIVDTTQGNMNQVDVLITILGTQSEPARQYVRKATYWDYTTQKRKDAYRYSEWGNQRVDVWVYRQNIGSGDGFVGFIKTTPKNGNLHQVINAIHFYVNQGSYVVKINDEIQTKGWIPKSNTYWSSGWVGKTVPDGLWYVDTRSGDVGPALWQSTEWQTTTSYYRRAEAYAPNGMNKFDNLQVSCAAYYKGNPNNRAMWIEVVYVTGVWGWVWTWWGGYPYYFPYTDRAYYTFTYLQ